MLNLLTFRLPKKYQFDLSDWKFLSLSSLFSKKFSHTATLMIARITSVTRTNQILKKSFWLQQHRKQQQHHTPTTWVLPTNERNVSTKRLCWTNTLAQQELTEDECGRWTVTLTILCAPASAYRDGILNNSNREKVHGSGNGPMYYWNYGLRREISYF